MLVSAWVTCFTILTVVGLLIFTRYPADVVFMAGLSVLILLNIVPLQDALSGFSNTGMFTVAVLYVVVAGLKETGSIHWIVKSLLGLPKTLLNAQLRLYIPVMALSAFLNNTPVVAMLIPAVSDWSKKLKVSPSKLMLPLSYAAILGGTCTLIGTSTNLVVNGLVIDAGMQGLSMFEIAKIGLPSAGIGLLFLLAIQSFIPERKPAAAQLENVREYTTEMLVEANGALTGQTIEAAGLRQLPNAYLIEIERQGNLLPAVSPNIALRADDRLVFVGVIDSIIDLQQIRGLIPATEQIFKLDVPRPRRKLIEVVLSKNSPVVDKSVKEARFRNRYNAVIIAVHRNGERINKKIGDIVLKVGDTLLLEARADFTVQQYNSRDFLLLHPLEETTLPRHDRAPVALAILILMVFLAAFNILPMLKSALLAAGLMIITRCINSREARRSIDWSVLIVIAASFGLGKAMELTGAATTIANALIALAQGNPLLSLICIYFLTMLFTSVISNNGAAVLLFPIAQATATTLGVDFMPFVITIMMAASASFATPMSYQTNLMVYGPGGYRFNDYLRLGIPLNIAMAIIAILLIPKFWPF